MQRLLFVLIALCCYLPTYAQGGKNLRLWSATNRLTTDDFEIKTAKQEALSSFAQFSLDYEVRGINLFTRNFNKKVRNYLITSASWIDTTANVAHALRYQQTLFDISEIYVRKMRKALKENKTRITKATTLAKELNTQYSAEFSKRRLAYDSEISYGSNEAKQNEWEAQIQKELEELKDFAYDK